MLWAEWNRETAKGGEREKERKRGREDKKKEVRFVLTVKISWGKRGWELKVPHISNNHSSILFPLVFHSSFLFFYLRSRKLKRPTPPRVDITDGRRCVHLRVKEMLCRNFFIHKTMDCSPKRRKI